QHSDAKMAVFDQELLDEAMSHQTKMLLAKVPAPWFLSMSIVVFDIPLLQCGH
ncbi:hypothetical protein DFQ29_003424, partial [Apophysomyces sp. BC1021]